MSEPNIIDCDDHDPRLAELLVWRQRLIASGAVSPHTFKEAHVRMVLRSGRTDAEQIRMMLPDPVGEHADEMARVLSGPVDQRCNNTLSCQENSHRSSSRSSTAAQSRWRCAAATAARWNSRGPSYEAPYVVYRVVSGEDEPPYSPDRAHLVAATTAHRPWTARGGQRGAALPGVGQCGPTRTEALAAQPRLHAAGLVVARCSRDGGAGGFRPCDRAVDRLPGRAGGACRTRTCRGIRRWAGHISAFWPVTRTSVDSSIPMPRAADGMCTGRAAK